MITSKPKRSTIISLVIFLCIVGALIMATFNSIERSVEIYWYHYVFLVFLIPVWIGVFIKMIFSYKITKITKGKIHIKNSFRFKETTHLIKDIKEWKEVTIKTASGLYQQLEIIFEDNHKLTLGKQEHGAYDEIVAYLQRKVPKKRIK